MPRTPTVDPKWRKIQAAFEAARELPAGAPREACLKQILEDQPDLEAEVRAMLVAHETLEPLSIDRRLLSGDSQPSLAGKSIGPYQILHLLGRGGMGEVYLARRADPALPPVALKLLPVWATPELVARFKQEQRILARLDHPSIAALLDAGVSQDGRAYLVLQYVNGRPITEYCLAASLSIHARLRLFREVARAVDYAHRNLVVHRDLKPSNILVTAEGEVRLLDFGIAKLLDPSTEESLKTRPELHIMTPEYAAPEQIRGEPITTATDVHGLGVLLYELLTGSRPYSSQRLILENDPPAPGALLKQLRGDLDAIILKALDKDPLLRYASAGQMADDVERHLARRPVVARKASFIYGLGRFIRRNRVASALAALSLLLVIAFAVTAAWQSRRIARERDIARDEQQSAERVVAVLTDLFSVSNPKYLPGGSDLKVSEFLERGEAMVLEHPGLDPDVRARLQHVLGGVYLARSQYPRAKTYLEAALAEFTAARGADDPATVAVLHDLARLAAQTEDGATGISFLRASLARHQRILGDKNAKTTQAMRDLAGALPAQAERKSLVERSLAIEKSLSSSPSLGLALSLNALGVYHQSQGEFPGAVRYFDQALSVLTRLLPPGHAEIIFAMNNSAAAHARIGDLDKAASMHQSVIGLTEKYMGPGSVQIPVSYGNLGAVLAEKGRHQEAEQAFRQTLQRFRGLFGQDHSHVANSCRNLARVLQLQARYAEALPLMKEALRIHRKTVASPTSLALMEAQEAVLLLRTGSAQGLPKLRTAAARISQLNPSGHYAVADSSVMLAFALLANSQPRAAVPYFERALEDRRRNFPPHHPKIAEAECGLAVSQARLDRGFKACSIFGGWGLADPADLKLLHLTAE
ncbi:MAG: tetratricopeptide repeat protein [Acidimicrobiia bacterium]|nr:tetratricopeptide repeat protein [Acidimicrobiia bacterium]